MAIVVDPLYDMRVFISFNASNTYAYGLGSTHDTHLLE